MMVVRLKEDINCDRAIFALIKKCAAEVFNISIEAIENQPMLGRGDYLYNKWKRVVHIVAWAAFYGDLKRVTHEEAAASIEKLKNTKLDGVCGNLSSIIGDPRHSRRQIGRDLRFWKNFKQAPPIMDALFTQEIYDVYYEQVAAPIRKTAVLVAQELAHSPK